MATEPVPANTFSQEAVPGRGASQDGAYTDVGVDGAWTEPPPHGAYTANDAYLMEAKPRSTLQTESTPALTFSTEGAPSNTFSTESVPT